MLVTNNKFLMKVMPLAVSFFNYLLGIGRQPNCYISIPFPTPLIPSQLLSHPLSLTHAYLIPDTHSQTEEHTSSEAETLRPQKVDVTQKQQHRTGVPNVGRHYVPMWRVILISNCASIMYGVMTRSDYSNHLPDCKITAGHWPFSDHFSKWKMVKFQHGAFTLYTWPIKFMKNWKNSQSFQISYFALWPSKSSVESSILWVIISTDRQQPSEVEFTTKHPGSGIVMDIQSFSMPFLSIKDRRFPPEWTIQLMLRCIKDWISTVLVLTWVACNISG